VSIKTLGAIWRPGFLFLRVVEPTSGRVWVRLRQKASDATANLFAGISEPKPELLREAEQPPAVKNPAYFFILFSIVRRWLMCDSSMLS
jgi:hypothetical protein